MSRHAEKTKLVAKDEARGTTVTTLRGSRRLVAAVLAPVHYTEEAEDLLPILLSATDSPRKLLELGCGGGSLAHHLKGRFQLTLSDRSPQMLAVSREVNPECEHVLGDMRSLDLGREFDLVLIHDAIMYATDPESICATFDFDEHATCAHRATVDGTRDEFLSRAGFARN